MAGRLLLLPSLAAGVAAGIFVGDAGRGALTAPSLEPWALPTLVLGSLVAFLGAATAGRVGSVLRVLAMFALGAAIGTLRAPAASLPTGEATVMTRVGRETLVTATVSDEPRPAGERQQLVVDRLAVDREERPIAGRVLVWLPRTAAVAVGDRIRFRAQLEAARPFDGFDYPAYLARQGIGAVARAQVVEVLAADAHPFTEAIRTPRRVLLEGLRAIVPEPEAGLGAGILLGVRSSLAPEIEEAFEVAGLTHVVAVSGWNIAIVAGLTAAALQPLARRRGGRRFATGLAVAAVAWYVLLTGATPSVVRAALMAAAILIARLHGSRAHAASALLVAALLMLLAAPSVLWDVGFQLSLLATGGLIWLGGPLEHRLAVLPGALREPLALTVAAQIATLPVIVVNFERISLVAPLANLVVVPLVPLGMAASALAALTGALQSALPLPLLLDLAAWWSGGLAWLVLAAMAAAGSVAAALPLASVGVTAPGWLPLAWYPGLLAAWLLARRSGTTPGSARRDDQLVVHRPRPGARLARGAAGLGRWLARPRHVLPATTAVLGCLTLTSLPDGRLHVTALDIGQGDAILVEAADGTTLLVDGGPDPDRTLRQLGAALPFWRRQIDVVLLTHPHQDHVAGLIEVLARYRVAVVLHAGIPYDNPAYPRFLAAAGAERGGRLALAHAGLRVPLGAAARLEVLYPSPAEAGEPLPDGDINNGSVVAVLRHGAFAALLTGDAEAPVEARLVADGRLPRADLLKVGHHGSESSTTGPFVAAVIPRVALISCGRDNEYGHPATQTVTTLESVPDLTIYRTDHDGRIEVVTDGTRMWVDADARPLAPVAVRDAARATGGSGRSAGSIATWPCRTSLALASSSPSSRFRWASCATRRESAPSRPPPPAWSARRASRLTSAWSRAPPSCTTSTSPRSRLRAASTAPWAPRASARWATGSWRRRWRHIPSSAC